MRSGKEATKDGMRSDGQVTSGVGQRGRGKEVHNGLVPRRIAWISGLAKADRKREYLFTDLAEICKIAMLTET